jgi:hypothetical protein
MTHRAIERLLRRLTNRQQDLVAGVVVLRIHKREWQLGNDAPTSLAVTTDKLAAAARSLKTGSTERESNHAT